MAVHRRRPEPEHHSSDETASVLAATVAGRRRAGVPAPKRTGSSAGRPVSAPASRDRGARIVSSRPRVLTATAATRAGRAGQRDRARAGRRARRAAGSGGPGSPRSRSTRPVAEHVGVRRRAVDQPERDARVRRMDERALALDPEQLAAALARPRRRAARPRRRGSPRRPRRPRSPTRRSRSRSGRSGRTPISSPRLARRAVELDDDGHLPDRAVGADGEDDLGVDLEVRAGRDAEPGRRPAQVAQLDAVLAGEPAQLGVVADELVQPVLDVEARADRAPSGARARRAGTGRPGSRRRRAPWSARRRALRRRWRRSGSRGSVSPARSESRIATTGSGA